MSDRDAVASLNNLATLIELGMQVKDAKAEIVAWATAQAEIIEPGGFSRMACLTALLDYKVSEYGNLDETQQMDSVELGYYVQTDAGEIKPGTEMRTWIRTGVTAVYGAVKSNRKRWATEQEIAGVIAYFVSRGLTPEAAQAAAEAIVADKDSRLQVRKAA
jgi:hypothetical protein